MIKKAHFLLGCETKLSSSVHKKYLLLGGWLQVDFFFNSIWRFFILMKDCAQCVICTQCEVPTAIRLPHFGTPDFRPSILLGPNLKKKLEARILAWLFEFFHLVFLPFYHFEMISNSPVPYREPIGPAASTLKRICHPHYHMGLGSNNE